MFFYSPNSGFGIGMILLIPAIILSAYAQYKVKSTFKKYLKVQNSRGYTGEQAARVILDKNNMKDMKIENVSGSMSDHYDPRTKVLRLSKQVYYGTSIASVSVAAHEAGHAIQHSLGYMPLNIRSAIAPTVGIASRAAWPLVFVGFITDYTGLIDIGIMFFTLAVFFQLVTLPVEFNASSRAIVQLEDYGLIDLGEKKQVKSVLNAAALTYIAAMAVALANLIRLIVLRNARD